MVWGTAALLEPSLPAILRRTWFAQRSESGPRWKPTAPAPCEGRPPPRSYSRSTGSLGRAHSCARWPSRKRCVEILCLSQKAPSDHAVCECEHERRRGGCAVGTGTGARFRCAILVGPPSASVTVTGEAPGAASVIATSAARPAGAGGATGELLPCMCPGGAVVRLLSFSGLSVSLEMEVVADCMHVPNTCFLPFVFSYIYFHVFSFLFIEMFCADPDFCWWYIQNMTPLLFAVKSRFTYAKTKTGTPFSNSIPYFNVTLYPNDIIIIQNDVYLLAIYLWKSKICTMCR